MAPTHLDVDPDVLVRSILVENIDTANITPAFTPAQHITTGTAEGARERGPVIAITPTTENVAVDTESGITSMHGGGGGAYQHRGGSLDCNCWGGTADDYSGSIDPQDVRTELKNEVMRVLSSYHPGSPKAVALIDYEGLIPLGVSPAPDDSTPQRYGFRVEIGYMWTRFAPTA